MIVVRNNKESNYTDADLIDLLRKSHNGIMDIIYYKHKDSAIRFMKKRYDDEDVIMDVYLESMTAIYKNILNIDSFYKLIINNIFIIFLIIFINN